MAGDDNWEGFRATVLNKVIECEDVIKVDSEMSSLLGRNNNILENLSEKSALR